MGLEIDPKSGVPIYQQIMNGIKESIVYGTMAPGEKLPSVRELASRLRVNPNTVAKAYGELRHDGVVESRWGDGNFVSEKVGLVSEKEKSALFADELRGVLKKGREMGLSDDDMGKIFLDTLKEEKK